MRSPPLRASAESMRASVGGCVGLLSVSDTGSWGKVNLHSGLMRYNWLHSPTSRTTKQQKTSIKIWTESRWKVKTAMLNTLSELSANLWFSDQSTSVNSCVSLHWPVFPIRTLLFYIFHRIKHIINVVYSKGGQLCESESSYDCSTLYNGVTTEEWLISVWIR